MPHAKHAVPAAGNQRNFIQGFGDPSRLYLLLTSRYGAGTKTGVGRCAKHDRAGLHATPWDPTAFP